MKRKTVSYLYVLAVVLLVAGFWLHFDFGTRWQFFKLRIINFDHQGPMRQEALAICDSIKDRKTAVDIAFDGWVGSWGSDMLDSYNWILLHSSLKDYIAGKVRLELADQERSLRTQVELLWLLNEMTVYPEYLLNLYDIAHSTRTATIPDQMGYVEARRKVWDFIVGADGDPAGTRGQWPREVSREELVSVMLEKGVFRNTQPGFDVDDWIDNYEKIKPYLLPPFTNQQDRGIVNENEW